MNLTKLWESTFEGLSRSIVPCTTPKYINPVSTWKTKFTFSSFSPTPKYYRNSETSTTLPKPKIRIHLPLHKIKNLPSKTQNPIVPIINPLNSWIRKKRRREEKACVIVVLRSIMFITIAGNPGLYASYKWRWWWKIGEECFKWIYKNWLTASWSNDINPYLNCNFSIECNDIGRKSKEADYQDLNWFWEYTRFHK